MCAGALLAGGAGTAEAASAAPAIAPALDVVAVIDVDAPGQPAFVLRATIPVPKGTYPRADGLEPLSILDHDGAIVPTQVELVSRYPRESDGADVVEVLGRVNLPPGTAQGTRLSYQVVDHPHPRGIVQVPQVLGQMINTPGSLLVVAKDCFGHQYGTAVYEPGRQPYIDGRAKMLRNGVAAKTVRTYGMMLPATNNIGAPNGALPHMFGVHSYITGWDGEGTLTLDLRIHNGPSNHDKQDSSDDILGDVYYESLELWVPKGWTVLQQGPDPLFGSSRSQGTWTAFSLVEARGDGKMHFFPSQGQFHRRLAICKIGTEAKAQRHLDMQMLGFCKEGVSPTSGNKLWSWWNPQTARYFPQRYVLPNLDHVGLGEKQKSIDKYLDPILSTLKNGSSGNPAVIKTGRLGYAHPWGVAYGGMTGGGEIYIFDGVVTASLASQRGYLLSALTHRMYQDRQPDVFFDKSGEPTSPEQWLQPSPSGQHVNMYFKETLLSGPDPFGFHQIDPFQVNHVQQKNLKPDYESTLKGWQPIDLQHHIRTTRSAKVLAWLGNDHLAKDDLRMRAELFRLGYHPYNNDSSGGYQGSGLKGHKNHATINPGKGLFFGRGNGWGIDAVNAAYSLADTDYRSMVLPWFKQLTDTVAAGQFTCNGFIQAKVNPKMLGGNYQVRQQYEEAIVDNALRGALESALRDVDASREAQMKAVVSNSALGMISPMSWDPVQRGPYKQLAVAPLQVTAPAYCGLPHPSGGTSSGVELYQSWSSFAYGYELTGDQTFLGKAAEALGGDLKTKLHGAGIDNIENRAALLALSQQN